MTLWQVPCELLDKSRILENGFDCKRYVLQQIHDFFQPVALNHALFAEFV